MSRRETFVLNLDAGRPRGRREKLAHKSGRAVWNV